MGCPYPAPPWEKAVKKVLRDLGQEAKILDLGSGLDRRTSNTINLEIEATPNVDVVGDGHSLPFKDAVFDAVISEAVLEHVQDPNRVASEIHRVLKPGGYVCAAVPFLQGFHASPHDYQRYTVPGFNHLFSAFTRIESGACAGPTASLHWIFREYVGLLFSFGNLLLAKLISLIVGWITFPAVWLDYLSNAQQDTLTSWHLPCILLVRSESDGRDWLNRGLRGLRRLGISIALIIHSLDRIKD